MCSWPSRPSTACSRSGCFPRIGTTDVFTFLPPDQQEQLLSELSSDQLALIFNEMDPDDRAVLFEEMPGQLAAKILALMRPEERRQTQIILGYPTESVGRIMTPDYLTIRPEWTLQQTLDFIRNKGSDAEVLQTMYVVDEQGRLLDDIRLRDIIVNDPQRPTIDSLVDNQVVSLHATDDREEAVRVMDRYDRPVLPVVDSAGVLVGIVTFDDVADVAQEEITEDIQKMGGIEALDEPYMSTSLAPPGPQAWHVVVGPVPRRNAHRLGHDAYQGDLERAVVLSLFLPLIISSGGNSRSASTLIIRAMALRELGLRDWFRVMHSEMSCGLLLGLLLGTLGFVRIHVWQYLGWADYSNFHAGTAAGAQDR